LGADTPPTDTPPTADTPPIADTPPTAAFNGRTDIVVGAIGAVEGALNSIGTAIGAPCAIAASCNGGRGVRRDADGKVADANYGGGHGAKVPITITRYASLFTASAISTTRPVNTAAA